MATVNLQGNPVAVNGELPVVGTKVPDFALTAGDLSPLSRDDLIGKPFILNIYPSVDTGTCAASTRQFNELINQRDDVVVVCVSQDLPFAFSRFCGAEGLEKIKTASTFRSPEFLTDFGVQLAEGPLAGLCTRAVVVVDASGVVTHTELVADIVDEPNYDAALLAVD
jgi:thiol peroxidase